MPASIRFRSLLNQFKKFRLPFFIFLLFWTAGIVTFVILEQNRSFGHIFLVSIGVDDPIETNMYFFRFYKFLWYLFFELLIISFILSNLQERFGYNPIESAKKSASSKRNHTVVLGYNHLGERIVEYLRENKKPYAVVEIDYNKVDDLINLGQPVIYGDYTDIHIMNLAAIKKCKEVFCVTSDLRRALIAADKVRSLNKDCDLYMRVFDDHFRNFLCSPPWNAYTFSTSNWNIDSMKKWSENIKKGDNIVVLGYDNIVKRIIEFYGNELKCNICLIDEKIDPEVYADMANVKPFVEKVLYIENLEERCDMLNVSQIYICWNTEEQFSDALLLSVAIKDHYPEIELYVRMFDDELAEIAKTINVTTFSTSAYAFEMLQKDVKKNSGIYPEEK
jgi:voltage-gated potassium channel Kch